MSGGEKNLVGNMNDQNLMVCLRVRPMNEHEINLEVPLIAHSLEGKVVVLLDPSEDPDDVLRANRSREKNFVFDHVFNSACSQEEVFSYSTLPLITQVIDGYTATVFAYGATGTGKTYSMLGSYEQPGIMVKALETLFEKMESLEDDVLFRVSISYLEVYNEMIRDLLNPNSVILDLREDQHGVQVAGLAEIEVHTTEEVIDILNKGNSMRTVEATAANKHSSRSHAVLQVNVLSRPRIRPQTQEQYSKGKLFLIDLAGSERASNTLNRGKRMTEGAHINRSLLALGNCINALSDPNSKRYVNYRDSKLTRLLKDALGGNCRTVMIAHISPTSPHFEDSRNTLVYADRAKHIRTKIHKNMYDVNFHLVQYNSIISELKLEINRLRNKLEMVQNPADQDEVLASVSEKVEELKLKDQLLIAFQKHINCKKTLSENLNSDMDLSLEETRCQVMIKEWELKKANRIPEREEKVEDEEMEKNEKQLELAGLDLMTEPDNVRAARSELHIARSERHKLYQQRQKIEQELVGHFNNIKLLEKRIPECVRNGGWAHRTLELICRLHRMEVREIELQTENILLRQHSTRHELVQTALMRHCDLCSRIISMQSSLISEAGLETTKELEMIMELYNKDEPSLTLDLSKDLIELDKNYFGNLGQIIRQDQTTESNGDLRDMTSNMSINDVAAVEEKEESNVSLPAIDQNLVRNTPDTWDNESLQPSVKQNTSRLKSIFDEPSVMYRGRGQLYTSRKYNNNISSNRKQHKKSYKSLKNQNVTSGNQNTNVVFPGIRGRQLLDAKHSESRSKSLEPSYMNHVKNRRRVPVPKLDPLGNVLFDNDTPVSKYNHSSKLDPVNNQTLSGKLFSTAAGSGGDGGGGIGSSGSRHNSQYNRNNRNVNPSNYRIPRSTLTMPLKEEKMVDTKLHRASEIRKLNERKTLDGIVDSYSLEGEE